MGKFAKKVRKNLESFSIKFDSKRAIALQLPMDMDTLKGWVSQAQDMTKDKGDMAKPASLLYMTKWIGDSLKDQYPVGTSFTLTVGEETRPGGIFYLEGVVGAPAFFTEEYDGILKEFGYSMQDMLAAASISMKRASLVYNIPANMGSYRY